LVDKAVEAAVAAIEVYNKPSFTYREEAFSILMINAWELLLKARILKENDNRMRSIEVWEPVRRRDGSTGRRVGPRKNRTGTHHTVSLQSAWQTVRGYSRHAIDDLCVENLQLLLEIRDNAVHLGNKGRPLRKGIQEVSAGALRNFLKACSSWFGRDLSAQNFAIMPLVFESPSGVIQTAFDESERGAAGKLLSLISRKESQFPFDPARPFNLAVELELKFVRRPTAGAVPVRVGAPGGDSLPVFLTEEEVLAAYPWRYNELLQRLANRYTDFVQNRLSRTTSASASKGGSILVIRGA
jgi:hypothetical protein